MSSKHGRSKLTLEQVLEMRLLYTPRGERNVVWLAERYGVSIEVCARVLEGRTWRHCLPAPVRVPVLGEVRA